MEKYGLQGALKALPGRGDELAGILLEAAEALADAKGCRIYLVARDAEDRDLVRVMEVWDSREDHDASLKSGHVRALVARAMPLLDGPPQKGNASTVIGGKGLG